LISDSVTAALAGEQSVLIPAPPPTRVLDLLILLDNAFSSTPILQPFPIFYLARTSQKAIGATRTMLEWLSQDITLQDRPLDFKWIKIVSQYSDLLQGNPGPRVVIADGLDLQSSSFARQAFLDFKSSGHLLLFPSRIVPMDSLAHKLLEEWDSISPALQSDAPRPIINIATSARVQIDQRIPLTGEDLAQWKRQDKLDREQKESDLFFEERQRNILEGNESDEDEDEENQLILDEQNLQDTVQRIRGSAVLLQEGVYDFWLGEVSGARSSLKHFPFVDKRRRFDEFGVMLKPDEFVHVDGEPIAANPIAPVAPVVSGGKRKWVEVEMEVEDIPARLVSETQSINIAVRIGYVDLEGLHDGRAVGNLLPRLNARKMVMHSINFANVRSL
jgi:cleavage and polyadenylation specificity factor subunit 2